MNNEVNMEQINKIAIELTKLYFKINKDGLITDASILNQFIDFKEELIRREKQG